MFPHNRAINLELRSLEHWAPAVYRPTLTLLNSMSAKSSTDCFDLLCKSRLPSLATAV